MIAITDKKGLAAYLERRDIPMLNALKELSATFGPFETVIYVEHNPNRSRSTETNYAPLFEDGDNNVEK